MNEYYIPTSFSEQRHSPKDASQPRPLHTHAPTKSVSEKFPCLLASSLPTMAKSRRSNGVFASQLQLLIGTALLLVVSHSFTPFAPAKCRSQGVSRVGCPLITTNQIKSRKSARKQQTWLQTATAAPSNIPPKPILKKPLISATALVILDIAFRRLFQALAIEFPSSLAGCGVLLATFLTAPFGDKLYDSLNPGSTLLAKWLPVFFVPSLVTLPLAGGFGSAVEVSES